MARRIFEAVIGIVLLVTAFILAFLFQQSYRTGVEYQSLPVPIAEISPYTVLSAGMFEMKDFPRALSGGYATSLDQLSGQMANSVIPAGLPIPLILVNTTEKSHLADPSSGSIVDSHHAAFGGRRTGARGGKSQYLPDHSAGRPGHSDRFHHRHFRAG